MDVLSHNIILLVIGFSAILCLVLAITVFYIVKSVKLGRKIDEISHNDSLTGVYNRRFFMELAKVQFARSLRTNVSCFFLVFNLDNFKSLRDSYGYLAADHVLMIIAERAKNTMRPYDILGRYTDEGFIILMTGGLILNG